MKTLVFLTGVRGAGKSSILERLKDHGRVLQPSTSRAKRVGETDEYDFVSADKWGSVPMAWTIQVGINEYGMRLSEIERIPLGGMGLTVFAPGSLEKLAGFLKPLPIRFFVIGLDTVNDLETLGERVGNDTTRLMTQSAFDNEKELVRKYSDVILKGNIDEIYNAAHECLLCMQYPATLTDSAIRALCVAKTLLTPFDPGSVQSASYDLHLGDEYWCRGKREILTAGANTLQIPAYSYVLVTASEEARLPRFIHARFDVKVSLFFDGAILSNGPQVDPGYSGNLFCLLFNCSDRAVVLRRGEHFSTIEFQTTVSPCEGYKAPYQFKTKLDEFMSATAVGGPGGTIVERLATVETKVGEQPFKLIQPSLGVAALMAAICLSVLIWSLTLNSKTSDAVNSIKLSASDISASESRVTTDSQRAETLLAAAQTANDQMRRHLVALCGGEQDQAKCDSKLAVFANQAAIPPASKSPNK